MTRRCDALFPLKSCPQASLGGVRFVVLLAVVLGLGLSAIPTPAPAQAVGVSGRQVTLFAIEATPGSPQMDPKLQAIAPQLRELLPDHGFRLIRAQSRRLASGQTITCDLGGGSVAQTQLVRAVDESGKVELQVGLRLSGQEPIVRTVRTPPNQLFFCDKTLPGGSRLLIGVGAR